MPTMIDTQGQPVRILDAPTQYLDPARPRRVRIFTTIGAIAAALALGAAAEALSRRAARRRTWRSRAGRFFARSTNRFVRP